jgi:hypothetical protein
VSFSLEERRPIETDERGNLIYHIYGQDGALIEMRCADNVSNRHFVIWLRQVDRYSGVGPA